MQIIPTILQSDIQVVKKQLQLSQSLADVELVQIDIMDGQLTPDRSVSLADLTELDFGRLRLDIHLMTEEPMDFVWELLELKDWLPIASVTAQIERMSFQPDFLEEVQRHDWKAGLSLELYTPFDSLHESAWQADIVQLLAVEPGSQGQALHPMVYQRLTELQSLAKSQAVSDREPLEIWVDGGVKPANIAQLAQAGATGVTVGSHLWQSADVTTVYQELLNALA